MQKNQKTEIPPMKLFFMDMDEAYIIPSESHEASPDWPFSILVTGRSGTGKTNLLANLVLEYKSEHIYKRGDIDI